MIFAAPVDAVGFKRVAAVGAEQRQPPARPQHAHHLADGGSVILHVFQHFVAEQEVEAGIGEGQPLAGAAHQPGARCPDARLTGALQFDVEPHDAARFRREV